MYFDLSLVVQLPDWASVIRIHSTESLTTSFVGCLALAIADYICRLRSLEMLSPVSNYTASPVTPNHTSSHRQPVHHEVRINFRHPSTRCQRSDYRSPAAERQRKREHVVAATIPS